MKKLTLSILEVQFLTGGAAVIITRPSKDNPSANGVHKLNAGQFQRIVERTLGVYNPAGFKHIVSVANGAAKLTIDAEQCKAGDPWENKATGEKGVYLKDWIKYSNHAVELGAFATMKLAELSLSASFQQAAMNYSSVAPQKVAVVATSEANVDQTEGNTSEDDKSSDAPTI